MSNNIGGKVLTDEELEAIAGGITVQASAHQTTNPFASDPNPLAMGHTETVASITAPHTTMTPTNTNLNASNEWFAAHSAPTAATPHASDAQNTAIAKSIYESTPGQAPVQSTGSSMAPPNMADPNRLIHTTDPATGKQIGNAVAYNIYE